MSKYERGMTIRLMRFLTFFSSSQHECTRQRVSIARAPPSDPTAPFHAHCRSHQAEHARIPPKITPNRPHGAECDPPHDPQQHTTQEACEVDLARVATLRPVVLGRLLVRRE